MQNNKFVTERLVLREITEKDASQIVTWRKNPEVYQFFRSPHELTYAEHMKWYNQIYSADDTQIHFIAEEKIAKKDIGVFSVRRCQDEKDCVEVNYLLDKDAQGKGYSQEAVLGMIEFAKQKWSVVRVIAEIHEDNQASRKMIERLGFQLVEKKERFLVYERHLCYT